MMNATEKQPSHPQFQSYLLRIWMEDAHSHSQTALRIVLVNLQTGNRHGFVNFERLANFLSEELPDELNLSSQKEGESGVF